MRWAAQGVHRPPGARCSLRAPAAARTPPAVRRPQDADRGYSPPPGATRPRARPPRPRPARTRRRPPTFARLRRRRRRGRAGRAPGEGRGQGRDAPGRAGLHCEGRGQERRGRAGRAGVLRPRSACWAPMRPAPAWRLLIAVGLQPCTAQRTGHPRLPHCGKRRETRGPRPPRRSDPLRSGLALKHETDPKALAHKGGPTDLSPGGGESVFLTVEQ